MSFHILVHSVCFYLHRTLYNSKISVCSRVLCSNVLPNEILKRAEFHCHWETKHPDKADLNVFIEKKNLQWECCITACTNAAATMT
jgi:NADH:ubiquinone oxidoreductase subunit E